MSTLQGRLPVIFSISFVLAILATAAWKLKEWQGPMLLSGIVMVGLYLAWIAWEGKVAMAETKMSSTGIDKGTLEFYAAARFATVFAALIAPTMWTEINPTMVLGIAVFVAAVLFRLVAIRTLGKFYSHRVRVRDDHQIVSEGPYRFVRHPAYTGMLTCHLGFVLFFFNWIAFGIWALIFVPAVAIRILVEEKALFEIPGYPAFAATRKRLLPFIW